LDVTFEKVSLTNAFAMADEFEDGDTATTQEQFL